MEQYVSLRRKGRNNKFTRFIKSNYVGWLFNLPLILGLIIFTAVPMCLSLFYSFNDTFVEATGVTTIWCGLRNYISIFEDDEMSTIVKNTVIFTCISVPLNIVLSYFLPSGFSISF